MGGGIALSFASKHPAKVRNLCLVAPVGFASMRTFELMALSYMLRLPCVGWLVSAAAIRFLEQREWYGGDWLLETPEAVERLQVLHDAELSRLGRERKSLSEALVNSLRWFSWSELGDTTSTFTGPALVIWGRKDRTVPEASAEAKLCLPQAQVLLFERHGHALPLERPDVVADAFEKLVQEQKRFFRS
eukprot:TRINITY_DN98091_c0_g1_i1.p1 TRINITY_DN98091_c0_g1~~TRINITY_DN98091_c0_g1_i1.p1  ORF type:complete len:189 (-),score=39.10 TRINITY_DN98091_c0_g1_i1:87-653(-)